MIMNEKSCRNPEFKGVFLKILVLGWKLLVNKKEKNANFHLVKWNHVAQKQEML